MCHNDARECVYAIKQRGLTLVIDIWKDRNAVRFVKSLLSIGKVCFVLVVEED
jgi:hypothetical protein